MLAARKRLEIAAHNLANVSTDGFRGSAADGFLNATGVVIRARTLRQHGPLRHTGRNGDLAIVGDGAFLVRDRNGNVVETRNGAFTRDGRGRLRDDAGRMLIETRLVRGSSVRPGYLESANVDAIGQMIQMLAAERSYETAEKCVAAIDAVRQKAATDVAKVT